MKEHDVVILKVDYKELKKDSVGTIIYVYSGTLNNNVLVEFQDNQTEIIPLKILEKK